MADLAHPPSAVPGPRRGQARTRLAQTALRLRNRLGSLGRPQTAALDPSCDSLCRSERDYPTTGRLDELRATDYSRLDAGGHAYLDYTGGGLHAERQLAAHVELLRTQVLGNPHSSHAPSMAATALAEGARAAVLEFFNAPADEYLVIFTQNASGALRLVGEAYPFARGGRFLLTFDNHNSVNGIREFARARGASLTYAPLQPPDMRLQTRHLAQELKKADPQKDNLFAFPAQSNFTGVQHELRWIAEAQSRGWDVLLDAAAFVPTNRLDLTRWKPDFVPVSFYKIFGYPTGIGCLLARRSALAKLHRPWFSGGSIWAVTIQGDRHYMATGEAAFEDGTIDYLALPAVEIGLRHIREVGMDLIHTRVGCLTRWLLKTLTPLRHSNGRPLLRIYGPSDGRMRGATIALNVLDPAGHVVDERVVERRATAHGICLRTGCFCNPGAGEVAFGVGREDLTVSFAGEETMTYEAYLAALGLESAGALRVSLGIVSNHADVERLIRFLTTFLDDVPDATGLQPRLHC